MTKIYTRTGDSGQTGLLNGQRVPKNDLRIEAIGTIDELNSALGLIHAHCQDQEIKKIVQKIQSILFTIGAILGNKGDLILQNIKITPQDILQLEKLIDHFEQNLPPLKNFIYPGETKLGAFISLSRTVCRRAERRLAALSQIEQIQNEIPAYLNRLSDLLFVLERHINRKEQKTEKKWHQKLNY